MRNNKAILSVDINSIELNYEKYRELILGPIFFDFSNHPIGVIDTKKFSYKNEKDLKLEIEITIKGISYREVLMITSKNAKSFFRI